jgi:integrase
MARGRKPSVRYWPSRKGGGYFCNVKGQLVELALGPDDAPAGPTYLKALDAFCKRIALESGKGTAEYLVSALFNQYRLHLKALDDKDGKNRYDRLRLVEFDKNVKGFSDLFGHLKVSDLRAYHFDEWFRTQPGWNDTSRHHAGRHVIIALNWAAKRGYIPYNHLDGKVELPKPVVRGREARMAEDLCELLINAAYSPAFRLFLRLLHLTGCRPIELRMATAANYRAGKLVYHWNARGSEYRHKNAKTKKDRVIHLPPQLIPEVEALAKKHPEGALFRTPRGKRWNRSHLSDCWRTVLKRKEVAEYLARHQIDPAKLTTYNFRHSFASRWLDSGRSIYILAELMGTSVDTLTKVYGHPDMHTVGKYYRDFLTTDQASRPAASDVIPISEGAAPRRTAQG